MSNKDKIQEELLNKYFQVSRKLGKLLTRRDITTFICSHDKYSKYFSSVKKFQDAAVAKYPALLELEVPVKVQLEDVEKHRLDLQKKKNSKSNKDTVTTASFLQYLEDHSNKVFNGKIKAEEYKSNRSTQRYINIVLSDLHIGADINGEETGSCSFGRTEEARRLAKIVKEVCNYKKEYRKFTELNIILLGDLIQGTLGHDPRDGAELAEQYCRAIHLLGQAIGIFSSQFKKVNIYCNSGNHDRITTRHPGRAIHSKYDSYATMLCYSLMKSCSNLTNVNFEIPKTPYVLVPIFDKKVFAWHGDTGIKTGNIHNSINISNIEKSINKINASLIDNKGYVAFVCGHLHIGTTSFLPNGSVLIVNGGLPPVDSFGLSLGQHEANSGQIMWESVPEFPVGDIRFLRVDQITDQDESLDEIIIPWKTYND